MGNQNSRLLLEAASSGSLPQLRSVLNKADVNAIDEVGDPALLRCSSESFNHVKTVTWRNHVLIRLVDLPLCAPGRLVWFALQLMGGAQGDCSGTSEARS